MHFDATDIAVQCSAEQRTQLTQTDEGDTPWKDEHDTLKLRNDLLRDEINDVNFQLSSLIIQRTVTDNVSIDLVQPCLARCRFSTQKIKECEREIGKYQSSLEAKTVSFNELQHRFDEQSNQAKKMVDELSLSPCDELLFSLSARTSVHGFEGAK